MNPRHERGSAILVVLTFVAVLTAILLANAMALHHLRAELRRIDQQQQRRWETAPPQR